MIGLLVFVVRVLMVLFVVRLLLRTWAELRRPRGAARPAGKSGPSQELVRDRVCNTFLPRDRALMARVGAEDAYFCSAACRERALAAASRAS